MTVRTDIKRIVHAVGRGRTDDEAMLLRYYGADGPVQSQADLAAAWGVTRQAVHARIGRLLARIEPAHLNVLTVDPQSRNALMQDQAISRRLLDGIPLEVAAQFYRDITGTTRPPKREDAPMPQIPAAQFDALVLATYGPRRKDRIAAARQVLVQGMDPQSVAKTTGISVPLLKRTALEIADLHAQAVQAYNAKVDE